MLVAAPADPGRSAGPAAARRAGPLQVAKAVLWSFLGIRKRAAHENDAVTITPVQVIVAGIIGAAIFVLSVVAARALHHELTATGEYEGNSNDDQSIRTLFHTGAVDLADHGLDRAALHGARARRPGSTAGRRASTWCSPGFAILAYMIVGWFHTVAHESETGKYNKQVDVSLPLGHGLVHLFRGDVLRARSSARSSTCACCRCPGWATSSTSSSGRTSTPGWPVSGPGIDGAVHADGRVGHPRDQHADPAHLRRHRDARRTGGCSERPLAADLRGCSRRSALGVTFLGFQIYEYGHAYSELNLKLTIGAYGATFFMLTGFHGFHVTVGRIMLIDDPVPLRRGPFHARAPLRLRGRRLVLALRRRRVAGTLHLRLLAIRQKRKRTEEQQETAAQQQGESPRQ